MNTTANHTLAISTQMAVIQVFVFMDIGCVKGDPENVTEISLLAVPRSQFLQPEHIEEPKDKLTLNLRSSKFNMDVYEKINDFINRQKKPVSLICHNGHQFDFIVLKKELQKLNVSLSDDLLCADSVYTFYDILKEEHNIIDVGDALLLEFKSSQSNDKSSESNKQTVMEQETIKIENQSNKNEDACHDVPAEQSTKGDLTVEEFINYNTSNVNHTCKQNDLAAVASMDAVKKESTVNEKEVIDTQEKSNKDNQPNKNNEDACHDVPAEQSTKGDLTVEELINPNTLNVNRTCKQNDLAAVANMDAVKKEFTVNEKEAIDAQEKTNKENQPNKNEDTCHDVSAEQSAKGDLTVEELINPSTSNVNRTCKQNDLAAVANMDAVKKDHKVESDEEILNEDLENYNLQQQNEKTPEKRLFDATSVPIDNNRKKLDVNSFNTSNPGNAKRKLDLSDERHIYKGRAVRTIFFENNRKPDKSFKLGNVYDRIVKYPPVKHHPVENDVYMQFRISHKLGKRFLAWTDQIQEKFSNVIIKKIDFGNKNNKENRSYGNVNHR